MTRHISRSEKEYDPQFVSETQEAYIIRIGGRRQKTQKDMDLIFGGWI